MKHTIGVVRWLAAGVLAGVAGTLAWQHASSPGDRAGPVHVTPQTFGARQAGDGARHGQAASASAPFGDIRSIDDVERLPTRFERHEALQALVRRADLDQLRDHIGRALSLQDRYRRSDALKILVRGFAVRDAPQALAHLISMNIDIGDQLVDTLFRAWGEMDLEAAVSAANDMIAGKLRKSAGHALLHVCAEQAPERLSAIAARLVDHHDLAHIRIEIVGVQANRDPEAAIAQALRLASATQRRDALQRVGYVWGRSKPEDAFHNADAVTDPALRKAFLEAVVAQWVVTDTEATIREIQALPNDAHRVALTETAMGALVRLDASRALEVVGAFDGPLGDSAYKALFNAWAAADPASAARALAELPAGQLKTGITTKVAAQYVRSHPEAALAWAVGLKERGDESAWRKVLLDVARAQPTLALEAAGNASSSAMDKELVRAVLSVVAPNHPQEAARFLQSAPEQLQDYRLYNEVGRAFAKTDPDAALAWAAGLDGEAYRGAVQSIGQALIHRDPDVAARYLAGIEGSPRSSWIEGIAAAYAKDDANKALSWLRQFEGEPGYRDALPTVVSIVSRDDPASAIGLVNHIAASDRLISARTVVRQWATTDPEAAAIWIETAAQDLQVEAAAALASNWPREDADGLTLWINRLKAGPVRDRAILQVVIGSVQPGERELALLATMHSQNNRDQAIGQVAARIYRYDRETALDFMERAGMSADVQDKFVSRLEEAFGAAGD